MASTTVRIDRETHTKLQTLACELSLSMQEIVARAVEAYRRERIFDQADAAYAALRADPVAWQTYWDDHEEWEQADLTGSEDEPYPLDGGGIEDVSTTVAR